MASAELKIDVRRKRILEMLERTGQVYVTQLSTELGASSVTIRSDLKALEENGYLERIQGGAVLKARLQAHATTGANMREKQAIGKATADIIHDGDTIFLNAGTTTREVAVALKCRRNLNIVTNSIAVATELSGFPSFRVILLGGELNTLYAFTCGGDAQEQLRKYQADYAILSLDGVSVENGVTTYHADEAIIDRIMVERANKTLIVADHTKMDRAGFSYICPVRQVHTIVTDNGCDFAFLNSMKEENIRIICADLI